MVIVIVDDDTGVRGSLDLLLKTDHEVICCDSAQAALGILEKRSVDLVITDNQMPGMTGLDLLRKGKELSPTTSFLMMTAFGSVENAIEAIRLGADDYFMKPFHLSEIEHRVQRIEDLKTWKSEKELRNEGVLGLGRIVGKSAVIANAIEFIKKVAPASAPVLILGPSGSGKEVIARAVHETSPRVMQSFIAVNCASLSEQLMESELFGHEKGAFTGANSAKPGKFELARGGTIFLDEIGELPAALQAKLLRVLQEKEFYRVGGTRQIRNEARVIAATNRPIKEMVRGGTFREDLYFRLNVLTFEMLPLAARPDDLPLLIDHLWSKTLNETGKKVKLSPETLGRLRQYSYPGNVRELQNTLERLAVLAPESGVVEPKHLPSEFYGGVPVTARAQPNAEVKMATGGLNETLEALESELVLNAMREANHNQVRAAELLKITRGALQYKLKKYNYHPPSQESGDGGGPGQKRAA